MLPSYHACPRWERKGIGPLRRRNVIHVYECRECQAAWLSHSRATRATLSHSTSLFLQPSYEVPLTYLLHLPYFRPLVNMSKLLNKLRGKSKGDEQTGKDAIPMPGESILISCSKLPRQLSSRQLQPPAARQTRNATSMSLSMTVRFGLHV